MSDPRPSREGAGYLSLEGVGKDVLTERPEDSELGLLRELGKDLVNYIFMALRTLAIHDEENEAVEVPLQRLGEILERLSTAVHRTHFITVEGQIYLNDLRIKMEASAYTNVLYLVKIMDKHGIGGITFNRPVTGEPLKRLLLVLLNTKPPADMDEALNHARAALAQAEVPGVDFDRPYFFKAAEAHSMAMASGDEAAEQESAALAYAKGILAVKDYFRAVQAAEAANPLRIRKIVQDLVDVAEEDPDDFLKLHIIHGVEDAYYNHCVNVASLSVAIGLQLQLSRLELADLGASAMFHDVGYSSLERIADEEDREFSEEERRRLHPVMGFKTLLRQGEYGPGLLRRLLVILEHHMHFRRPGGFPNLGKKRLSVYTRIIQVADHYDALVSPNPAGEPGILPIKALERIIAASGKIFDPLIVKTLVNVVGRYPYGSLVALSSKEVGVVTCGGRDQDSFLTPRVMVVRNADGTECAPREVDLRLDRSLRRRVRAVLDPFHEDLTPHAVLFDQLGDRGEEESQEAAVDADAWTQAIWSGKSVEELLREGLDPDAMVPEVPAPEAEAGEDQQEVAEPPPETKEAVTAGVETASPQGETEASSPEGEADHEPEPWERAGEAADEAVDEVVEPPSADGGEDHEPEPWEVGEAADQAEDTAAAAEVAPSSSEADEARELEPWEVGEAAEAAEADGVDGTAAATEPGAGLSESEVAACKKAQQKAISEAYSREGEEAVQALAAKHWSEFKPDTDGSA
ncbi:MAG: HD domain-containing protein [Myxococcota bacterium]|nr:HD domain-containing protein [Myxococcota bacterium]